MSITEFILTKTFARTGLNKDDTGFVLTGEPLPGESRQIEKALNKKYKDEGDNRRDPKFWNWVFRHPPYYSIVKVHNDNNS